MSDNRSASQAYGGQEEKKKDAGQGAPRVTSPIPKGKEGQINPSAPNDVTVTPGSTKP